MKSKKKRSVALIISGLVTPHMACVTLAAIFNVIAAATNKRGFALTGAVLYCVGAVLFLMYALFVVPSIVLSFVGYARLGKLNNRDGEAVEQ